MEKPLLNNPDIYPADPVLAEHLGSAKAVWDAFVEAVKQDPSLMLADWKFYHDGKAWLSRVMAKKKTVCWISVWGNCFKVTFYFSDKAAEIKKTASAIDASIKKQWASDNKGKTYRGITLMAKKKSDLKSIKKMMAVKAGSL